MVTITLPPDLELIVTEHAKRQGTTPELWAIEKLSQTLKPEVAPESSNEEGTMLEFFSGYVGVLNSSEIVPGGARMSEDIGRKFAEGMVKKRQEGRL